MIYIEVPCFNWICRNRAWFDIFYEHVNYFRLSDFPKIFGRMVASGNCFGAQYLYVVGDLSTLCQPTYDPENTVDFPPDFTAPVKIDVRDHAVEKDPGRGRDPVQIHRAFVRGDDNAHFHGA